jgi:hypothetical protein
MLAPPPQPRVLLAEADEGPGYCVTVIPPPAGPGHDKCFTSYLHARAYARLLRFGHGWLVVDRVDAETRKAAEEADQARRNG